MREVPGRAGGEALGQDEQGSRHRWHPQSRRRRFCLVIPPSPGGCLSLTWRSRGCFVSVTGRDYIEYTLPKY